MRLRDAIAMLCGSCDERGHGAALARSATHGNAG